MPLPTYRLYELNEFASDGKIALLCGDALVTRLALYGVIRVAADGHRVWVLDGANSFDAYFVARLARRWNYAPETLLSRIRLSRAFTCYQMAELATRKLPVAIGQSALAVTPASSPFGSPKDSAKSAAVFCLGLLETFYDEDVPLTDAGRLLKSVVAILGELARCGYASRILITAREPRDKSRNVLLNLLKASADRIEYVATPSRGAASILTQPRLIAA